MKPDKIVIAANAFGKMAVEVNNEIMFTDEWQVKTPLSKEEKEFVDKEYEKQLLAYEAIEYQRKRKPEYPSLEECVHAILDYNLEELQAKRLAVKEKYPKPELKDGN